MVNTMIHSFGVYPLAALRQLNIVKHVTNVLQELTTTAFG